MFRQLLNEVSGIDGYLLSSMLVFVVFFAGVLLHLFSTDKKHIEEMSNKPLN